MNRVDKEDFEMADGPGHPICPSCGSEDVAHRKFETDHVNSDWLECEKCGQLSFAEIIL